MVIMHKNNLFMYFFSVFPYTFCIFAIKNIRSVSYTHLTLPTIA